MPTNYHGERDFFDRKAGRATTDPMTRAVLERYASPRWPHLFGKEKMFQLAGNLKGKRILEIGCGTGVASVQLAYCGALVEGLDLSPVSIEVAARRAEANGVAAKFTVCNVVDTPSFGRNLYDVVWCDLILHHLVDALDSVMHKIEKALRPGGLFVAREPVAYAHWLKKLRKALPIRLNATPDEQPFRKSEFAIVRRYFPNLCQRHYRLLARVDRVTNNQTLLRLLGRLDIPLLKIPGVPALAGNVVMWATKTGSAESGLENVA